MYRAWRPKGLDFNMAVGKEFNFVVCAWTSNGYHDGVPDAFKVKLDSALLQATDKMKQLFQTVHNAPVPAVVQYINA